MDKITQDKFLEARLAARAAITEYYETSDAYIRALEDKLIDAKQKIAEQAEMFREAREVVRFNALGRALECPECGCLLVKSDTAGIEALDSLAEDKAAQILAGQTGADPDK